MLNYTAVPLLFHVVLTMAKAFIVLCDVFFLLLVDISSCCVICFVSQPDPPRGHL